MSGKIVIIAVVCDSQNDRGRGVGRGLSNDNFSLRTAVVMCLHFAPKKRARTRQIPELVCYSIKYRL